MESDRLPVIAVNETVANKSPVYRDLSALFAGHLLIAFYCLIFVLGFLGNSAVIYVAIRKRKYRNVTNCYVINLALADLLFLTVSIPHTTFLGLVNHSPFNETICKVHTYLAYVFLLATCNTLAAMSIDRYFYILLPKSKLQWRTPNTAFVVCLIIWTSSLALIVPYHIITHVVAAKYKPCASNGQDSFLVCFFIFCSYYAIPLAIIIVFYTKLAMHVIQSNRLLASHMSAKSVPKFLKTKQRRVTRMVIVVTLVFAVCWLPIHTLELMNCAKLSLLYTVAHSHPKVLYTIRAFAHALAYLNSCLNPYLYALLNRNFCFDLIDIIPSYFACCERTEPIRVKRPNPTHQGLSTSVASNEELRTKPFENDDDEDDEDDVDYKAGNKENNVDVSCQAELLRV